MERATEAGDLDAANRLEVRYWLDGPLAPEGRVGGAARQLALDMNAIALRSPLGEGAGESGLDAWGRLGEIRAPATMAWGDLDEPDGIALYRAIAGRLPALVDTRVLPGMAHLPSLERPEVVAALIAGAVGR
jgi:pimeloyl-ACP methyl ester carboxylesterase